LKLTPHFYTTNGYVFKGYYNMQVIFEASS